MRSKTVTYSPNTWEDIFDTLEVDNANRVFVHGGREALEAHRASFSADDYMPLSVNPFDAARIDEAIERIEAVYEFHN